jgi:hypothetical protein
MIIIMHIYNWYHPNVTGIHYVHEYRLQYTWRNPLAFLSPLANSLLLPSLTLLYLLGNPPSCDRIRPPWSQVACKLTSPSQPFLHPYPLQIPRTQVIKRLTMTTSRLRRLLSGTVPLSNKMI